MALQIKQTNVLRWLVWDTYTYTHVWCFVYSI